MNDQRRRWVIAGIMGISNIGVDKPEWDRVHSTLYMPERNVFSNIQFDAEMMTEYFAQQYIENDEHYAMFAGEITSWYEAGHTEAYVRETWPECMALMDRADEYHMYDIRALADTNYPVVEPLADMTREQFTTLFNRFKRGTGTKQSWPEFVRSASPAFGGDCITVSWCGMTLGIEKDGYAHT